MDWTTTVWLRRLFIDFVHSRPLIPFAWYTRPYLGIVSMHHKLYISGPLSDKHCLWMRMAKVLYLCSRLFYLFMFTHSSHYFITVCRFVLCNKDNLGFIALESGRWPSLSQTWSQFSYLRVFIISVYLRLWYKWTISFFPWLHSHGKVCRSRRLCVYLRWKGI